MAGRQITIEFLGRDRSAGATATKVEQKFGKLGGRLDKVGQAAGKVLAGGLLLAGAAAVKMGQAAAEDEAAAAKLATTLRNVAGATDSQIASTEAWISAQGKALGVSDDELRPALSRLVTATHDVGKAQELAALAMDVSAGTGKSLESVSTALMKAQNGQVSGLSRLGIATTDAHGKTLTLEQVTRKMAETYKGQAAKAAETTAGKQKILTVQLSELGEQIGTKLLPVMVKLSDIALKMVDWISQNTTTVGVLVGAIGGLLAVVWAVSAAMRAWIAITAAWKAVQIVATNVQWAFNAALAANPIGLVVVAIAALVVGLVIAYKKSETFRKIVNGAFTAVWKAAKGAFEWVKKNWPKILAILTGPVGIAVLVITKNWDKIKAGAGKALDWVKSNWKKILLFLTGPIGIAVLAIMKYWDKIKDGARGVVDFIREIPGRLRDLAGNFADAGHALINSFVDGMRNAAGIVTGIAGNVWSAVKSLINSAISKINAALSFTINLPGPDIHVSSSIPYLAKGGVVRARQGGTLALLGEAGHDEAVIPLSGPHAPRGVTGGSDTYITVNIHDAYDPIAVGKQLEKTLSKYVTHAGRPLQVRTV